MYSAYVLTKQSRNELLELFPPIHADVIAHHITYAFPAKQLPPEITSAKVVGHVFDDAVEALIVELDGEHSRPDGGTFHITWSIDRYAGAKPVHSNKLLNEKSWNRVRSISIDVIPDIL